MGKLQSKVAIITGAGQGGGRGCALALAAEGAATVLFGRTASKLAAVVAEIEARGSHSIAVKGDAMSADDRQRCIDQTLDTFGGVDILINTAIGPDVRDAPLLDAKREVTAQLWESGFVATTEFMRACHPHMKARGGGSIINFGSGAQQIPMGYTIYGGVKAAVQAMSRGAAIEWAKDNIRVNVVFPLAVSPAWEVFQAAQPDWAAAFLKTVPMGRMGDPESDIGVACAFLASDDSRFITGTTLALDGGHSFVR